MDNTGMPILRKESFACCGLQCFTRANYGKTPVCALRAAATIQRICVAVSGALAGVDDAKDM